MINMGFPYIISHLPVLLILGMYVFNVNTNIYFWKSRQKLFLFLSTILFFIARANDFLPHVTTLDESQWIVCARSVDYDIYRWLKYFYLNDFTRVLTILPLVIVGKVTGKITYLESSLLFNGFLALYLWIQFECTKLIFKDFKTSINSYCVFLVVLALANQIDFISYNSEAPSIFLISLSVYVFILLYLGRVQSKIYVLTLGAVVAMIPFAKEQGILIALFLFFVFLFFLIKSRRYDNVILYLLGCCISSSILLIPLFLYNSLDDVINFILLGIDYSVSGFVIENNEQAPFDWNYAVVYGFKQIFNAVTIFPLIGFFLIIYLWLSYRKVEEKKASFDYFFLFLIYFLFTLLTILTPKNFKLLHYSIFLFPVLSYSIIFLFHFYANRRKMILLLFYSSFLGAFCFENHRSIFNVNGYRTVSQKLLKLDYYRCIKDKIQVNDKLMIWGFGHNIYSDLSAQRATGFLYPQFAFGETKGAEIVRERYLQELQREAPEVVLEVVGKTALMLSDTSFFSIKNAHAEMYKILLEKYSREVCNDGFVIWKKIG